MGEKQCSKCRRFLPESSFYKKSRAKSGLRSNCKECVSAQGKKYRKDPLVRQRKNQRNKEWARKNRKRFLKICRRANAKTANAKWRKRRRILMVEDRMKNPDKHRVRGVNKRAKEASVRGIITEDEWVNLRNSQNGVCPCCGQKIEIAEFEVDHINPICKGGPNLIENIQPLCSPCNDKKHWKTIRYIQ